MKKNQLDAWNILTILIFNVKVVAALMPSVQLMFSYGMSGIAAIVQALTQLMLLFAGDSLEHNFTINLYVN